MEEIVVLIKQKAEIPQPGEIFNIISAITETKKQFKVKKITHLKWNCNGDLVVTMEGRFVTGSKK